MLSCPSSVLILGKTPEFFKCRCGLPWLSRGPSCSTSHSRASSGCLQACCCWLQQRPKPRTSPLWMHFLLFKELLLPSLNPSHSAVSSASERVGVGMLCSALSSPWLIQQKISALPGKQRSLTLGVRSYLIFYLCLPEECEFHAFSSSDLLISRWLRNV